jgi:hypothetical protein
LSFPFAKGQTAGVRPPGLAGRFVALRDHQQRLAVTAELGNRPIHRVIQGFSREKTREIKPGRVAI